MSKKQSKIKKRDVNKESPNKLERVIVVESSHTFMSPVGMVTCLANPISPKVSIFYIGKIRI